MDITAHLSPNFSDRRNDAKPDLIVLHYTAMATATAALERLCDPAYEVSTHYLIGENGADFQLVAEDKRAWHAGAGSWGGCLDVNSASIGIELANDGCTPFSARQFDALEKLLRDVMARHAILPERIIGHSDMAPARKTDPGVRFDWRRLALGGLSVWPETSDGQTPDEQEFSKIALAFGYSQTDGFQTLLNAFRMRFRPWAIGPLDRTDMAMITDLARRFPVDQPDLNA